MNVKVKSLYDIIRILQRSLTGDNTLEFEGSFIKEVFKYLVTGDTLNMIGDIDIHIATVGNNGIYNEILSDKLGIDSVSGGRNTYIYKMEIDKSDIIMFKDLDEADIEIMLLNPFRSPYNVLGIPKLIFYSNGGMILQSVYEHEQYVGIETPHDINIPFDLDIDIICPNQTTIIIKGVDLVKVTQKAAEIRSWRLPEPYKGKGIFYKGETIRRKEGKKN